MRAAEPTIRSVADTACWAAVYRARETERPDALFRDPFARRLAGQRGEEIAGAIPFSNKHTWSWITRTYLFDKFIAGQIREGVDFVLNLAAGLDARPYRMELPALLRWVEVDLPEMIDYKEQLLGAEKPRCTLERVRLDLANVDGRWDLFARLGRESKKTLVISEGLIIYLTVDDVANLARDLAAPASFQRWVTDLCSPGLLKMLQRNMGPKLSEGNASLQFGPAEGPEFFTPLGWKPLEARSLLHTAGRIKRLPFFMRLVSLISKPDFADPNRLWGGVCLLGKR
jgi:methyltransferase (TIGR00027 family)